LFGYLIVFFAKIQKQNPRLDLIFSNLLTKTNDERCCYVAAECIRIMMTHPPVKTKKHE